MPENQCLEVKKQEGHSLQPRPQRGTLSDKKTKNKKRKSDIAEKSLPSKTTKHSHEIMMISNNDDKHLLGRGTLLGTYHRSVSPPIKYYKYNGFFVDE